MSFTTLRVTVGRVLLVLGVLVLLFIPYLLWATGLSTARAQHTLRTEFSQARHRAGETTPLHSVVPTSPPRLAPPAPAPALGGAVGFLSVPRIGLSMVIVEGTGTAQLEAGPGHYPGTPLPGQSGNVAIAGHRTTYLHPFYSLDQLEPGDPIEIETLQGMFVYRVTATQIVAPGDIAVVGPTPTPTLTLTTCNPRYSASQRLVVHAALTADTLYGPTGAAGRAATSPASVHAVALPTPSGSRVTAVLWGVVVAAVITAVWALALRTRGRRRGAVLVVGLVVWLATVYVFFEALAPLLPAQY